MFLRAAFLLPVLLVSSLRLTLPETAFSQAVPVPAPTNSLGNPHWITALGASEHAPQVISFHRAIHLDAIQASFRVHVSADNRFILYVNGQRIGEGPARGDRAHWRYETFDLKPYLHPGGNLIAARVWNFGDLAPVAQISLRTAFLMWSDNPEQGFVNTNSDWTTHLETGWQANEKGFLANDFHGVGPGEIVHAGLVDADWNLSLKTDTWQPALPLTTPKFAGEAAAANGDYEWHLVSDAMPSMEYADVSAGKVIRSSGVSIGGFPENGAEIPAHARATLLLDREALTTAYPELLVSGGNGAKVSLTYAEALVDEKGDKGNRNDTQGKHMNMAMIHDEYYPDGASHRSFIPLWWRTWRFLQIDVETGGSALTLDALKAHFTGYPFRERASFRSRDPELGKIWEVGWRTLRANAHETHMDCPYWEQLQYAGDSRLEIIIDYVVSGDDRLAEQTLRALSDSALPNGLTQSRYPNRDYQVIPPFSLLWIGMLHDYWWYRPNPTVPKDLLPRTRTVLQWFIDHQRKDGMLAKLPEDGYVFWHFIDWSYAFHGSPPEDEDGGSIAETLQFLAALRDAADLEDALGDPARAAAYRDNAARVAETAYRLGWDERRQLLADTPAHRQFSQQANILGVMLDVIPRAKQRPVLESLFAGELAGKPAELRPGNGPEAVTPASYYFRFYLARALDHAGMGDSYVKLLGPWRQMLALGLSTWAETPEPTRSDAHAWSAHPNYDLLTIVAGIRPDAPGFARVRIAPHLNGLVSQDAPLEASMPYGDGSISVSYRRNGDGISAEVDLPSPLSGVLVWREKEFPVHPGRQRIELQ